MITYLKNNWAVITFICFILSFASILIINPQFAPTDDFVFWRTLQKGHFLNYYSDSFPYFPTIKYGRFTPLVATEYNLASYFSAEPFSYYATHAIQFILFAFFFAKLLSLFIPNRKWVYAVLSLLALSSGFTFVWFRMQMNERNVLFFSIIFILLYINYLNKKEKIDIFLGLVLANIIIYYKETAFILIGAFAFFHLILAFKKSSFAGKLYDFLLMLSSGIYLLIYGILVLPYGGVFTHGKTDRPLMPLIKGILNETFVSDPFIMFIVLPFTLYRAYLIIRKKSKPEPLYDSLLVAGSFYVFSYFILNLSTVYYFLPVYAFALPAIFHFFIKSEYKKRLWRNLVYIVIFITLTNSVPLGMHYLTFFKYQAINFDKTFSFLTEQAKNGIPHKRPNFYFDGVYKGGNNWGTFLFSEYLLYKGATPEDFDIRSNFESLKGVPKDNPLPLPMPHISLPYTIFQQDGVTSIESGDYLIVTPQSIDPTKNPGNEEYLKSLDNDYELVFKTNSRFEFPFLTLKEMGRYLLSIGASPEDHFLTISRKRPNFESPDYYVYIKK